MTHAALIAAYKPLEAWLFHKALPLWADVGRDKSGGFYEKITHAGVPTDDPRRTRLVARQIFAFAAAREMGWAGLEEASCDDLIAHGLAFFHERCVAPSGLVYSVVRHDGPPPKPGFDSYDHAFALFALATAARAGHDAPQQEATARAMLAAMKDGFAHPEAGFYEGQPPAGPLLANPHMHLFEAALEWLEHLPGDAEWGAFADSLAELALRRFVSPDTGAIREEYGLTWAPWEGAPEIIEPGHQYEWAWLLIRWGRLRDRQDAVLRGQHLIEIADTHGIDADGMTVNALDADLKRTDADRRLWPETERIKAQLIAGHPEQAALALTALARHFNTQLPGLWDETLHPDGSVLSEPPRGSSLYHIICALREVHRAVQAA